MNLWLFFGDRIQRLGNFSNLFTNKFCKSNYYREELFQLTNVEVFNWFHFAWNELISNNPFRISSNQWEHFFIFCKGKFLKKKKCHFSSFPLLQSSDSESTVRTRIVHNRLRHPFTIRGHTSKDHVYCVRKMVFQHVSTKRNICDGFFFVNSFDSKSVLIWNVNNRLTPCTCVCR